MPEAPGAAVTADTLVGMADVLRWQAEAAPVLDAVHDSYEDLVVAAAGDVAAQARATAPELADALAARLQALPAEALGRLLLAPEITRRLLYRSPGGAVAAAEFLAAAAVVETERAAGGGAPGERVRWSALGDCRVEPDGRLHGWPGPAGWIPLDFGSPHAAALDLVTQSGLVAAPRPPVDGPPLERLVERLHAVRDGLGETGDIVAGFAARFTKVLVLQVDEAVPYSSGSNGQYIGRSLVVNAHWDAVDEADLAEAIVHEAIHALLYMQEEQVPWVLDHRLYDATPRVRSPWSGAHLPVRPYLQACFVWYGLLHFWAQAYGRESFPPARARRRLEQAATGFLRGPLLDRVRDWLPLVAPACQEAIEAMQAVVLDTFGAP